MDAIDLLRHETQSAWGWLEETVRDVTDEQANWQPPGTANSIGKAYAHLLITADAGFNSQLHGGMPIMATEFKGQIGLLGDSSRFNEWESASLVDWATLRAYGRAVERNVHQHLEAVTDADFEKPVDMRTYGLGMWKGIDIYHLHGVNHPREHGGEIGCLKGLQDMDRGFPDGWLLLFGDKKPRPVDRSARR